MCGNEKSDETPSDDEVNTKLIDSTTSKRCVYVCVRDAMGRFQLSSPSVPFAPIYRFLCRGLKLAILLNAAGFGCWSHQCPDDDQTECALLSSSFASHIKMENVCTAHKINNLRNFAFKLKWSRL